MTAGGAFNWLKKPQLRVHWLNARSAEPTTLREPDQKLMMKRAPAPTGRA